MLRDVRNETYIVKTAPEQILLLTETGILDPVIERSSFLFINRVDKLAQAISLAIAAQNNRWDWRWPGGLPDDRLAYAPPGQEYPERRSSPLAENSRPVWPPA